MNQQSQHVVTALEGFKVILEKVRVDLYLFPRNQPGNGFLQPLEIHVDIGHQGFCRGSLLPVGAELPLLHGQHDGIGIVDGPDVREIVPVIPASGIRKVHPIAFAQPLYLAFRKTGKLRKPFRVENRIFPKIRNGRLGAVLLDGQDARHVGRSHYPGREVTVLEPPSEYA